MSLEQTLESGKLIVAPSVHDALTASLAANAGADALYLSGAAIAHTRLGRRDGRQDPCSLQSARLG